MLAYFLVLISYFRARSKTIANLCPVQGWFWVLFRRFSKVLACWVPDARGEMGALEHAAAASSADAGRGRVVRDVRVRGFHRVGGAGPHGHVHPLLVAGAGVPDLHVPGQAY